MRLLLAFLLVVVVLPATAQTHVDSIRVFVTSFFSSFPIGLVEEDAIREFKPRTIVPTSCTRNRFQRIQSALHSATLKPDSCGRSCLDLRMLCLVYRQSHIDTLGFSATNSMVLNHRVYLRDDDLLWSIARCLPDQEVRASIAAILHRPPNPRSGPR